MKIIIETISLPELKQMAEGMFGNFVKAVVDINKELIAVDAQQQQNNMQPAQCDADQRAFMKCLDSNSNDISSCQFYLDMLKQCKDSSQKTWN